MTVLAVRGDDDDRYVILAPTAWQGFTESDVTRAKKVYFDDRYVPILAEEFSTQSDI